MGYAYPIDSKVVTNPNGTIDYDRASSSTQLRGLIKSMITNGVNLTESTNLQVMADEETMNLVVKPGYVIIEGALKHFEDDVKVTIGAADTTNPRIDTVVARLNLNEDVRDIVIDVLQGTPSAEPMAPELTRTTSYYEVGLADILVELGTTQISQDVVTDTRLLNSRCGLATSIGEIDTETLFVQLTTDFDNWFEGIKDKLGDDVAGNLQLQIDGLADDIDTLQDDVEILKGNDSTMMCDIDDEMFADVEGLTAIPMYSINSGYLSEFVELNGDLHYFGYGKLTSSGSSASYHFKFSNGEWTQMKGASFIGQNSSFCVHNGVLYGSFYAAALYGTDIYKYSPENDSWSQVGNVSGLNGNYARHVKLFSMGDLYAIENVNNSLRLHRFNGSSSWVYISQIVGMVNGTFYDVCTTDDDYFYMLYFSDSKYCILPVKLNGVTYYVNDSLIYTNDMVNYRDRFYKLGNTCLYTCKNPLEYGNIINLFTETSFSKILKVFVYNNELHILLNDSLIRVLKVSPYRKAKAYGKAGTKLYLPNYTEVLTDNLQKLDDNTYKVTEDGEIQIKIYE